jgi:lipid A 4'-phosphatase
MSESRDQARRFEVVTQLEDCGGASIVTSQMTASDSRLVRCTPWEPTLVPTQQGVVDWPFRREWPVLWPLVGLIVASAIIRWTDADLRIARLCFDREQMTWTFSGVELLRTFSARGQIPAVLLGVGGWLVVLLGRWLLPYGELRSSRSVRRAGLFLGLLLLLGPGLLINGGFKLGWARPRPSQCHEFGGDMSFVPVGNLFMPPSKSASFGKYSSFPSGHAAVAFYYLMAPGFVISRKRPRVAGCFFIGAILLGGAMGIVRILQGAHFFSDVMWSGGIVYFVGVALARLVFPKEASA